MLECLDSGPTSASDSRFLLRGGSLALNMGDLHFVLASCLILDLSPAYCRILGVNKQMENMYMSVFLFLPFK